MTSATILYKMELIGASLPNPENDSSNFEKVVDFNQQFGVLQTKTLVPKTDIIRTDPKQVEFCLKLIREECNELEQAVKDDDFVEVVDALTDILYVVYGMGARMGVNMDAAFRAVHENNMSKLCKTEEKAQRSVAEYEVTKEKTGYDTPAYRRAPDGIHWVVYNESTKKILKSVEWKPVDLKGVCGQN